MKLYVVDCCWKNNTMTVDEIEVVEKPKSYNVADKDREKAKQIPWEDVIAISVGVA